MFSEHSTQKEFQLFLITYYCFQWVYGWLLDDFCNFEWGYSTASFIGLFLLARYIRKYKPVWSQVSLRRSLLVYLSTAIFATAIFIIVTLPDNPFYIELIRNKLFKYNSPFVIASAIFLVLAFSKLNIGTNKYINSAAASCFAIYLIHCHPLLFGHYADMMRSVYQNYSGIACLAIMGGIIIVISVCCILIDKIRIYLWKNLISKC